MNHLIRSYLQRFKQSLLSVVIAISVASCGAGAIVVAGISGTGISGSGLVIGMITGFGSIFVNGVEYEIDNAIFDVDGILDANQDQLKIGMVVKLDTTSFDDGRFEASSVIYDDAVEGPVLTVPATPASGNIDLKEFKVLGVSVIVNALTTSFNGVTFDTIGLYDVVEVSGFIDADSKVIATLVEKKGELQTGGNAEIEMHGRISSLNIGFSFELAGLTVYYDDRTELDDLGNGLMDGLLVEVKGIYNQSSHSIEAKEIEGEDDERNEIESSTGQVSLHGLVSGYSSITGFWTVNGISVNLSSILVSVTSQMAVGLEVEVAGVISNGVLVADKLEIRSGEVQFKALINSVNVLSRQFGIGYPGVEGEVLLGLDNRSQLTDELGVFNPMAFGNLLPLMEVKVEARKVGDTWVVTTLKRVELDEFEIEGVVTAANSAAKTLEIHGLTFQMTSGADYEIGDLDKTEAGFFQQIEVGSSVVKLERDSGSGLNEFDKAEID